MLNAIREFFDKHLGVPAAPDDENHRIRVATAALLTEMVRMDGEVDDPRKRPPSTPCGRSSASRKKRG